MKKTLKAQQIPFLVNTKNTKKRTSSPISNQLKAKEQLNNQPDQNKVKIVCPNCEFHFRIQPKLFEEQQHALNLRPRAGQDILQKLIEQQYSLISNYSRTGQVIENSPLVKIKRKTSNHESFINDDLKGLQRLQKLNQLNEMQKSRLEASRVTVRFKPSPHSSPSDQQAQNTLWISPVIHREALESPQIKLFQRQTLVTKLQFNPQSSRGLQQEQKQLLQSTIFDYYQHLQLLASITAWISANGHYKDLPFYLQLLIDQFQQKQSLKD